MKSGAGLMTQPQKTEPVDGIIIYQVVRADRFKQSDSTGGVV